MSSIPEERHSSLLELPLQQFLQSDPSLRLNRVAQLLSKTHVVQNEHTWVSSTRREQDGTNTVSIGTQALPEAVAARWGVGTSDLNEQVLVKLAHELSHSFQKEKGFEGALMSFLNGDNAIPSECIPYIELYAVLSGIGPISGLPTESVYAQQSRQTGDLKMETLEDITELIAAYIISDEYFSYRLEHSLTSVSYEQKEQIATKVIEVCRELH